MSLIAFLQRWRLDDINISLGDISLKGKQPGPEGLTIIIQFIILCKNVQQLERMHSGFCTTVLSRCSKRLNQGEVNKNVEMLVLINNRNKHRFDWGKKTKQNKT